MTEKARTFLETLREKSKRREMMLHYKHKLRNMNIRHVFLLVKKSRHLIKWAIIVSVVTIILIPIATYLYFIRDLTSKDKIINKKSAGVVLLDRSEKPFFTLFEARTKNVIPLSEIPEHAQHAFIAIEDREFYDHPGFSMRGIVRAIQVNFQREEFAQGGSTISQQLIKNTLLSPDKRLLRKYQELVLALELERRYTKDDILEMYLNTVYFGEGSFGIEDASIRYFSKSVKDLTLSESALLAAIIQAPSALSPISGSLDEALDRQQLVLRLMREQGYITREEEEGAVADKIVINPTENDINKDGVHFALMVQDALIEKYGEQDVAQSGFIVKTTLDLSLQQKAQQAIATQVQRLARSGVTNGAAVVIDPKNGEVLALVGSHDWEDTENGRINMAIRPRQPGSSFKPIIYAKAFEEKLITPATVLEDERISFGTYTPRNYDGKFRGDVLARYALANSLNIPAVKVMNMLGVRNGVEAAKNLGITTLDEEQDYGLPLVLGAGEVPLIEMTNAYAAFANKGVKHDILLYTEVRDKNGRLLDEEQSSSKTVVPESVAYLISSILSDQKARADTFGNALTISRDAAVKTGTTEEYRDALTIGYTPQVTVGVWIGNNDNTPMNSVAGSLGAAPIWRQVMEAALKGKPIERFQRPAGIVTENVCEEDGLKVEFATSSAFMEFFLRGTAPTKKCGLTEPTPTSEATPTDEPTQTPTPTDEPTPTNTPSPTIEVPTLTPTPSLIVLPSDTL